MRCAAPERLAGRQWDSLGDVELACRPQLVLSQLEVPVVPGQNASMVCRASGTPMPTVRTFMISLW